VLFLIVVTFSFVTVNQVIFWEDWVFCTSQEIGWGEGGEWAVFYVPVNTV